MYWLFLSYFRYTEFVGKTLKKVRQILFEISRVKTRTEKKYIDEIIQKKKRKTQILYVPFKSTSADNWKSKETEEIGVKNHRDRWFKGVCV